MKKILYILTLITLTVSCKNEVVEEPVKEYSHARKPAREEKPEVKSVPKKEAELAYNWLLEYNTIYQEFIKNNANK